MGEGVWLSYTVGEGVWLVSCEWNRWGSEIDSCNCIVV